MRKYIGKYRILCEWDRSTLEPLKYDTYISCYKDGQIYRVSDSVLAYYRPYRGNSNSLVSKLKELGVSYVDNRYSDGDVLIYFNESDLDIVAKEVNACISGVNIKPESVRNLRHLEWFKENREYYERMGLYSESKRELSDERREELRYRLSKAREVRFGCGE